MLSVASASADESQVSEADQCHTNLAKLRLT
jgi:hypothetical protein